MAGLGTYQRRPLGGWRVFNAAVDCGKCLHQTECLQEAVREEEEMLEAQSVPVREYLKEQLMPTLTQGLIQCCKVRPANPEDYLVTTAQRVLHTAGPFRPGCDRLYADDDVHSLSVVNVSYY